MKRFTIALVIAITLIFSMAQAATFEQISVTSGAVVSFTASKISPGSGGVPPTMQAFCTLETGSIRYTIDGTTPTSTVGHLMAAGASFSLYGYIDIAAFKAIAVSTTGVLSCSYMSNLQRQ